MVIKSCVFAYSEAKQMRDHRDFVRWGLASALASVAIGVGGDATAVGVGHPFIDIRKNLAI